MQIRQPSRSGARILHSNDTSAACHIDGAGITVAYKDSATGTAVLLLPRAVGGSGHGAGCSDGSAEEIYSANMVRCEVPSTTVYDQAICGKGWHICKHGELLANRGSKAPPTGYWLNAHVRLKAQWHAVYDNPTPGCFEHEGTCHLDETVQAVTDHDTLPIELPYVVQAWGCSSNQVSGSCATTRMKGAMCCR